MNLTRPLKPGENPLVPNAVLRQLYATMRALRASSRPHSASSSLRGQEAVYASSLHSLRATDLLCAHTFDPRKLLPEAAPLSLAFDDMPPAERLLAALGAASTLRSQGAGSLVLTFAAAEDLSPARWRQVLGVAGAQALPILFIALSGKRAGWLSSRAQSWGVPGIPVDSSDAIALYRVLQESTLRARHGDGPALIEPIPWVIGRPVDPLRSMQQLLRRRGLLAAATRATPPRTATPRSASSGRK